MRDPNVYARNKRKLDQWVRYNSDFINQHSDVLKRNYNNEMVFRGSSTGKRKLPIGSMETISDSRPMALKFDSGGNIVEIYKVKFINSVESKQHRIPPKQARMINQAMHELTTQFKELNGVIKRFVYVPLDPRQLMSVPKFSDNVVDGEYVGTVCINSLLFGNEKALKNYMELCGSEISPKNSLKDYLLHEVTHILEDLYCIKMNTNNGVVDWVKAKADSDQRTFSKEIVEIALKNTRKQREDIKTEVSKYAFSDDAECVAEALSYFKKSTKLSIEIARLVVERWIK